MDGLTRVLVRGRSYRCRRGSVPSILCRVRSLGRGALWRVSPPSRTAAVDQGPWCRQGPGAVRLRGHGRRGGPGAEVPRRSSARDPAGRCTGRPRRLPTRHGLHVAADDGGPSARPRIRPVRAPRSGPRPSPRDPVRAPAGPPARRVTDRSRPGAPRRERGVPPGGEDHRTGPRPRRRLHHGSDAPSGGRRTLRSRNRHDPVHHGRPHPLIGSGVHGASALVDPLPGGYSR